MDVRDPLKPIEVRKISVLPVTEISQVAEARRAATGLADQLAFDEADIGTIALIVTEAATNLAKHATGGEILLYALQSGEVGGIQVLALDKGPGIANAAQALRDGYSTTGSPGTGLGAIKRLATLCDIHSVPGAGTALLARLWSKPLSNTRPPPLEVGALSLPKPGEVVCGDRWAVAWFPERTMILMADGLGHGPGAAEAAMEAVRTFHERAALTPSAIVESIHVALRSTRGAAIAVTEIAPLQEAIRFAGVGNISGLVLSSEGRSPSTVPQDIRHAGFRNSPIPGPQTRTSFYIRTGWSATSTPSATPACSSTIPISSPPLSTAITLGAATMSPSWWPENVRPGKSDDILRAHGCDPLRG